jgi:pimeloyl-ACP methyl ester carboxylesterase
MIRLSIIEELQSRTPVPIEGDATVTQNGLADVRGCKINIRRHGRGEPLLFLHGAQGLCGREPGLEALGGDFEVVAPDHPGFGWSEQSDSIDDVADLALFYLDLLDALKLDRVHLVGHCIGGWIALRMAVTSSTRLRSLVLVNSAGIRVTGVPRGDMFMCSEPDLLKLLFASDTGVEWLKGWRATPELEDVYDRNRGAAARLSWSPRLCDPRLDRWLHRVAVPTHIIWGSEDRLLPPAHAEALKSLIAGSTAATLPGGAHMLHLEEPQVLAEQVAGFIRRSAR